MPTKKDIKKIIELLEEDKKEAEKYIEDMGESVDEVMKADNAPDYEAGIINQSDYVIKLLKSII